MLFSIIIPAYNCEKYVDKTIESIVQQNVNVDYEIIIIDDGSTDHTFDICYIYAKKYSFISVYNQTNQGVSVARNEGIKKAKGQYIMFLDADDYYVKNALNDNFIYDLSQGYDIICYSSYYSNIKRNRYAIEEQFKDGIMTNCQWTPTGVFGSCVYSKKMLNEYDIYFDKGIKINEDFVFKFKAFTVANQILFSSKFLYIYNFTNDSVSKRTKCTYDLVEAWKKGYTWLVKQDIRPNTIHAYYYVHVKIMSRILLYAQKYIQENHNKKEMIDELKKRGDYEMILHAQSNEVLPYLVHDLYLFQNDINAFIKNAKIQGMKIKYGRIILKIPLIRYLRDIRKYNIKCIDE